MDRDTNIRRAVPDDAPVLAEIHVAAWHAAYRDIVSESFLRRFTVEDRTKRFVEFLSDLSAETYVAETDRVIAGFLTLGGCRDSDVDGNTTGEIWGIYVLPSHWRRGIGGALCGYGENYLASRRFSRATLWVLEANTKARDFYEAMGFAPDGARKELQLGISLTALRYRKRLN